MKYKDFYSYLTENQLIVETPLSKSKNLGKILSTKLFTVYELVGGSDVYDNKKTWWSSKLKSAIVKVENRVSALIGKTMHVNVIIQKGKGSPNQHFADKRLSYAYAKPNSYIGLYEILMEKNIEEIERVLFHEYMHMVLFNKSKEVKKVLTDILDDMLDKNIGNVDLPKDKMDKESDRFITEFSDLIENKFQYNFEFRTLKNGGNKIFNLTRFLKEKFTESDNYLFEKDFKLFDSEHVIYYNGKLSMIVGDEWNDGVDVRIRDKFEVWASASNYAILLKNGQVTYVLPINDKKLISKVLGDEIDNIDKITNGKVYGVKENLLNISDNAKSEFLSSVNQLMNKFKITDKSIHEKVNEFLSSQIDYFNSDSEIKDGVPYNYFWMDNKFKPTGFSLGKIAATYYLRSPSVKYSDMDKKDQPDIRDAISKMIGFVSPYGLSDVDELWVNFFENLKKLPRNYRNIILNTL